MSPSPVKFSVVIPTSIDRGLILPHSIGSVLNQTVQDFEILVIGDGANDFTKKVIHDLVAKDSRIRFFDFPKHPRRGEENRHQVLLNEAKGKYISYLCDRDIMLSNHLETLELYLDKHDFASTLNFVMLEAREGMTFGWKNIAGWNSASWKLSCVGHSLDFYKKLPYGWRTTPVGQFTDIYMWDQFLRHPDCKSYSGLEATILWFKRGDHPGMSSERRKAELIRWEEIIKDKFLFQQKKEEAFRELMSGYNINKQRLFIRVKGRKISQLPKEILNKIKKVLFHQ
ncbi:glycosyltransferase family 2 protein [Algoriphagus marinus]|uniref:glycosyltransferase family 2 protein n=1 Tax=Algoriphagus marinus TaxID=1925762 RepID=UPI00094B7E2B|nr:glycosyltransferase [Algoriphagus marinus]